eukprot:2906081-Pyramimonas_sp.AAC.2
METSRSVLSACPGAGSCGAGTLRQCSSGARSTMDPERLVSAMRSSADLWGVRDKYLGATWLGHSA